jgi:uncharacterized membrane protein
VTAWPAALVTGVGLASAAWVGALLIGRVNGLATSAWDLAFFEQVVWNVGHTGRWVSSFHDGSFLGLHFSPMLVVPALIERVVWNDVRVLNLMHAAAIGALVPAAFVFLRAVLRPSRVAAPLAAGLAVGIPMWGSIQEVVRSDFHPEAAGVVLALLAGWAGLTGRPRVMWLCAIAALGTREDVAYAIGAVGLLLAVRGRGAARRHGRLLAVVAIGWAIIVFGVLMPWIRNGAPSATSGYYAWLGDGLAPLLAPFTMTDRVVAALTRPTPWFVVAGMVASVAALPLLRPRWLLVAAPPLTASMLSAHSWQANLTLQYPLILVVPLLVAAALGARRMVALTTLVARAARRRSRAEGWRVPRLAWHSPAIGRALPLLIVVPAVAGAWMQGALPPFDGGDTAFAARPFSIDEARSLARAVPAEAILVADEGLVAVLAGRTAIRQLTSRAFLPNEAYVLVDRTPVLDGGWPAARRAQLQADLEAQRRAVIADDGRFVLWGPRPNAAAP